MSGAEENRAHAAVETADFGLLWGVRSSFLAYVSRAGGRIDTSEDVRRLHDGRFLLPHDGPAEVRDEELIATFGGALRFFAHLGLMDFAVRDVRVRIARHSRTGAIECRGLNGHDDHARLALLHGAHLDEQPDAVTLAADDVVLADTAVESFGGVYPPGTSLDALRLRAPLRDAGKRPQSA